MEKREKRSSERGSRYGTIVKQVKEAQSTDVVTQLRSVDQLTIMIKELFLNTAHATFFHLSYCLYIISENLFCEKSVCQGKHKQNF